jgi:hypothetical protein
MNEYLVSSRLLIELAQKLSELLMAKPDFSALIKRCEHLRRQIGHASWIRGLREKETVPCQYLKRKCHAHRAASLMT